MRTETDRPDGARSGARVCENVHEGALESGEGVDSDEMQRCASVGELVHMP